MEDKNQKLIEKVNKLSEKLMNERNPFKRGLYTILLEKLNQKVQKEIDIIDIKEKYAKEKEERIENARAKIRENTKEKLKQIKLRDSYKREMREVEDFDPESPNFAFADELDMAKGDISELLDDLRKNGNEEIASKIEDAMIARNEHETAVDNLENAKTEGKRIQRDTTIENAKSTVKENALVVGKKANIFKRMFNAIKKGFQEFNQTRKDNKEFKKESENIIQGIEQKENLAIEKENATFEEKMEQLEEMRRQLIEEHKRSKEGISAMYQRQYDMVDERSDFRREIRNEAASKMTNEIVEKFNSVKQYKEENQNSEKGPEK